MPNLALFFVAFVLFVTGGILAAVSKRHWEALTSAGLAAWVLVALIAAAK